MTILTLDFETYFDANYTLTKLSNTEYIRDERFKVHGVGVKFDYQREAQWYTGEEVARRFTGFDWDDIQLLCHHTHFDALILQHHYHYKPAYYFDTLSMARPVHGGAIKNRLGDVASYYGLGNKIPDVLASTKGIRDLPPKLLEELGLYCAEDVRLTELLFHQLLPFFPQPELDLIHYTVKAYADPIIHVNKELAQSEYDKAVTNRITTVEKVKPLTAKDLRSRDKFAAALINLGIDPPTKISPRTHKSTYAFAQTDWEFQLLHQHERQEVRDLVAARANVASSIGETRALTLLKHADPALPIYLNYGKAHTLRWTGGDKMKPQNFERGSLLRNAMIAPPGYKFVIVDSAQIEARKNAWLAGETEILDAFREGRDLYSEFAADSIYNIDLKDVTKEQRFVGKVSILGLGYQMGKDKFQYTLEMGAMGPPVKLPEEMYDSIVKAYRKRYSNIKNQWYKMQDMLACMTHGQKRTYKCLTFDGDKVHLPSGMFLRYPRLQERIVYGRGPDNERTDGYEYNGGMNIYGGLLTENLIQALARNVVADQILMIAPKYRIVLMVHDEVILCVPEDDAEQALKETLEAFHTPPDWCPDLPVAGEGGITDFYKKM
jgi:DNA polymerase